MLKRMECAHCTGKKKCEKLVSEMNGFRFFKSKSNPVLLFKIRIQIQIRKQTVLKSKSCLNPKSYHFYISLHVIQLNMTREKILHHNSN